MYSLINVGNNDFDILNYVMSAMREQAFTELEIHNYLNKTKGAEFSTVVEISNEMLDRCNERMAEPE